MGDLIAVRARGGENLGQMTLQALTERWHAELRAKSASV